MKLADRTVEIHSRGMDSNNQFTIAQTSKMFKILSDSLYSDKVMAVVRELSTNAYDAHVAAGNNQPFKVILPTMANPNFTVRDYGTGLSQEDMEELYTTYGASNKNDSNDFVGCLGLGSKSPFAYTKSFSTTSYHNGKAYNYIAAMDEGGVPSLSLFGVTETSEPNGLEISFAVKQYDFDEFSRKAMRVFHYFKMKPIIEGGTLSTLNDNSYSRHNYIIEGEGWRIGKITSNGGSYYPNEYNNIGTSIVAIMGNIAYPVDPSKVIGDKDKEQEVSDNIQRWNRAFKRADVDNWKNLVREIVSQGMYLEIQFDIGELEMDVSREGLQYTKDVIKILQQKTSAIYLQLKDDMSTKIAECDSLVDAYTTYYKLSDLAGGWTAGADWTDPDGKVHTLKSGTDLEYKFAKRKQLYAINFRSAGYRSRRLVYLTDKVHCETLQGKGNYYWDRKTKSGPLTFFRADTASAESAKKIVTKYCNQNDCMAYLMVDSDDHKESDKGFDQLIKDIGGESNVVNVSDYRSLLNSGTRSKTRDKTGQISADEIFILSESPDAKNKNVLQGKDLNDSCYLRELGEDMLNDLEDETIIYFPIVRYASPDNYPTIASISGIMKDQKHSLNRMFDGQNIFAIKQSSVEKLRKQGYDLVDFNDWFKPQLKDAMQKLTDKVSVYKDIVQYCTEQYETEDGKSDRYYHRIKSDRKIVTELINIFGINYKNYIGGTTLCDQLDKWMIYNFFAKIMHTNFDMRFCTKAEYYAVMAEILEKHNLNGIDPEKVKQYHADFLTLKYHITSLYNEDYASSIVSKSKQGEDFIKSMPSMVQLRKNLKVEVDRVAMMKYIVCVSFDHTESSLDQIHNNPTTLHQHSYYGAPEWFKTLGEDKIEEMRNVLGSMVK